MLRIQRQRGLHIRAKGSRTKPRARRRSDRGPDFRTRLRGPARRSRASPPPCGCVPAASAWRRQTIARRWTGGSRPPGAVARPCPPSACRDSPRRSIRRPRARFTRERTSSSRRAKSSSASAVGVPPPTKRLSGAKSVRQLRQFALRCPPAKPPPAPAPRVASKKRNRRTCARRREHGCRARGPCQRREECAVIPSSTRGFPAGCARPRRDRAG